MRTTYRRFTIAPSGTVIDRASGREVGRVYRDSAGDWRGYVIDGGYQTGPWTSAYAAADAAWLVATAGRSQTVPA